MDVTGGPGLRSYLNPTSQRASPRLVGAAWALLIVNTLGSQGAKTIVHIPRPIAQMITMGSMLGALALALLLNPRLRIRPNAYLLLLTLLLTVSVASSLRLESGTGSLFRCFRLTVVIATLWLLSVWFHDGLTLVRHHVRALAAVLVTVAVGLIAAPGLARPETYGGRLVGAVWPMPPPQVGQYAAVVAGLTILLGLGRRTDRTSVLLVTVPAIVLLLLSHTRTAAIGLVAGLAIAVLSLTGTSARARRALVGSMTLAVLVVVTFGSALQAWLQRGQDRENFSNLTGRQNVWDALLAAPRTTTEHLIGVGLTNKSFNGLPIDSSWLAIYRDQGLVGVAVVVTFMVVLIVAAAVRPPSLARACALFLIVYCAVSSYTEVGLGDASAYLLHLTLAAALLCPETKGALSAASPEEAP